MKSERKFKPGDPVILIKPKGTGALQGQYMKHTGAGMAPGVVGKIDAYSSDNYYHVKSDSFSCSTFLLHESELDFYKPEVSIEKPVKTESKELGVATLETKNKYEWISVLTSLPEKGKKVEVQDKDGDIYLDRLVDSPETYQGSLAQMFHGNYNIVFWRESTLKTNEECLTVFDEAEELYKAKKSKSEKLAKLSKMTDDEKIEAYEKYLASR